MTCPKCHGGTQVLTSLDQPTITLVGPPNVGKSSLFNQLTKARAKTANVPGTTVEIDRGKLRLKSRTTPGAALHVNVIDLPGTYSLTPVSQDEQISVSHIKSCDGLLLLVIDAAALAGGLYLLGLIGKWQSNVVVVLSKNDTLKNPVDPAALQDLLGIPVFDVNCRIGREKNSGLDKLKAYLETAVSPEIAISPAHFTGPLSPATKCQSHDHDATDLHEPTAHCETDLTQADAVFGWAGDIIAALGEPPLVKSDFSDRLDRFLLKPYIGLPVFFALLWAMFGLATSVAAPLMTWADEFVNGPVASGVSTVLGWLHLADGPFEAFLLDGVLAGVATVCAFVPLMALIFLAIKILEDSGFMARFAFLADRIMRRFGLDGRAVLPIIVAFGCNLPALGATKTLPNAQQRLLTGLVIPLTSCPARLTVFTLLATVFFPQNAGLVVFGMYLLSALLVVLVAWILHLTYFRNVGEQRLIIVLPPYQLPLVRNVLTSVGLRVKQFLRGVTVIIVGVLSVVWLLLAIPTTSGHSFGEVPVSDSVYGQISQGVAPVFEPAGFGDWRFASSLITGFVAKEVAVGALAQGYAVSEPEDMTQPEELGVQMQATLERTSGGHPEAAALAFMVFVLIYTPCLATLAQQWRTIGGRWTSIALVAQLALAWGLAVAVFQAVRLW